jgi:hypothetical protein
VLLEFPAGCVAASGHRLSYVSILEVGLGAWCSLAKVEGREAAVCWILAEIAEWLRGVLSQVAG